MTTSILNDCILLKEQPSEKMLEYLHSINITIFDNLFSKKEGTLDFEPKIAVLYIIAAYSEESPFIIPRQDAKTEQENLCEYLQIPEIYRNALINLENKEVRKATTTFVEQFAGPLFRWLTFAKIQYRYYEQMVTNRDFSTQDEESLVWHYDIKEHGKCVLEMERLAKKIAIWERELKNDTRRVEGIKELQEYKDKGTKGKNRVRSGNIENVIE
jgi:hypothetical protein